jgi:hypothetical protein
MSMQLLPDIVTGSFAAFPEIDSAEAVAYRKVELL